MTERTCRVCGETKPSTEFYAGQGNTCKKCNNARTRAARRANPLKWRATRSAWEKKNKNRALTRRKARLKKRYKMTLEQLEALLKAQNYQCAICEVRLISPLLSPVEKARAEQRGGTKLAIDHSHLDGHVRGLLCTGCNTGLGQFEDNLILIKKAYYYLLNDHRKHPNARIT